VLKLDDWQRNGWLIVRLLKINQSDVLDPSGKKRNWGNASAFLLWIGLLFWEWQRLRMGLSQLDQLSVLLQTATAALLMVRTARVVSDFAPLVRGLRTTPSVMGLVLRQQNLQRILAARDAIGMLFIFVCLHALYSFLTKIPILGGVSQWVSLLCLPPLVVGFLWAIEAVKGRFRREARLLMVDVNLPNMDHMEQTLSSLANRSLVAQMVVREVFMSEVFRIAVTGLIAIGTHV
jgi:hypothetical protein